MNRELYEGNKDHEFFCHKIIEKQIDGSYLIVKDLGSGKRGQQINNIMSYINSNEMVCLRNNEYGKSVNEYNFDPEKIKHKVI